MSINTNPAVMQLETEIIDKNNDTFLREMMYEAIYVPENEKSLPLSTLENPLISKYIDTWGRKGDFGIMAKTDGINIGAIWIRYFSSKNRGFGFINGNIPELSMALKREYRNQGFGTEMMKRFLNMSGERGIQSISISVDKRNRAFSFYKRAGFKVVSENKEDYVMRIDI